MGKISKLVLVLLALLGGAAGCAQLPAVTEYLKVAGQVLQAVGDSLNDLPPGQK